MGHHNMFDNGQPQTCSPQLAGTGFIHPVKTLGQARDIGFRDATAGIGYGNLQPVLAAVACNIKDRFCVSWVSWVLGVL